MEMIDISKIKEKNDSPQTKKLLKIYQEGIQKNNDKKKKKYHIYSVINYSSNFKYINSTKEGDLIFFKCEGIIQDQVKLSDLVLIDDSIFIINDDFYQKNYLNFINKKCRPEEQMEDLLEKKD